MKNLFMAIVAVIAFAGLASAQTSATGTATGTVICPLQLQNTQALQFGWFTTAAGTISMNNAGSVNYSGPVAVTGGTTAPAKWTVTGQSALWFNVSIPTNTFVMSNGTSTINGTANNFNGAVNGSNPHQLSVGTGGCDGTLDLFEGGTITLTGSETPGNYSTATGGTPWTVTVQYN